MKGRREGKEFKKQNKTNQKTHPTFFSFFFIRPQMVWCERDVRKPSSERGEGGGRVGVRVAEIAPDLALTEILEWEDVSMGERVGEGAYAEVFKGELKRREGGGGKGGRARKVAVKKFRGEEGGMSGWFVFLFILFGFFVSFYSPLTNHNHNHNKRSMGGGTEESELLRNFRREVALMSLLEHQNIVSLVGVIFSSEVAVVMEVNLFLFIYLFIY